MNTVLHLNKIAQGESQNEDRRKFDSFPDTFHQKLFRVNIRRYGNSILSGEQQPSGLVAAAEKI